MKKQCGAKARTNGHQPCRRIPMANGRCRLHGGVWTGARTTDGKLRQETSSWKHGLRSKEALNKAKAFREMVKEYKNIITSY